MHLAEARGMAAASPPIPNQVPVPRAVPLVGVQGAKPLALLTSTRISIAHGAYSGLGFLTGMLPVGNRPGLIEARPQKRW